MSWCYDPEIVAFEAQVPSDNGMLVNTSMIKQLFGTSPNVGSSDSLLRDA